MDKGEAVLLLVKDRIRKNKKTNWGKNQILEFLDKIEEEINNE